MHSDTNYFHSQILVQVVWWLPSSYLPRKSRFFLSTLTGSSFKIALLKFFVCLFFFFSFCCRFQAWSKADEERPRRYLCACENCHRQWNLHLTIVTCYCNVYAIPWMYFQLNLPFLWVIVNIIIATFISYLICSITWSGKFWMTYQIIINFVFVFIL